jgi:putative transposase
MSGMTRIEGHLVLTTKYRRPALVGLEDRVRRELEVAASSIGAQVLEFGSEHGNHVHLVVRLPPAVSVAVLVKTLKSKSTLALWKSNRSSLRKFYWKPRRKFLWSSGYFFSTVGVVSRSTVLDYVAKQSGR